jgi:uncharacterized protein YlaI
MKTKHYKLDDVPKVEKATRYYIKFGKDRVVDTNRSDSKWRRRIATESMDYARRFSFDTNEEALNYIAKLGKVSKKLTVEPIELFVCDEFQSNGTIKTFIVKEGHAAKSLRQVFEEEIKDIQDDIERQEQNIKHDKAKLVDVYSTLATLEAKESINDFIGETHEANTNS